MKERHRTIRSIASAYSVFRFDPKNVSKSSLLRRYSNRRNPSGANLDGDEAFGGEDSERCTEIGSAQCQLNIHYFIYYLEQRFTSTLSVTNTALLSSVEHTSTVG